MPFESLSESPDRTWVGEAFAEAILANLTAAGEEVIGLSERNRKLTEMGFPPGGALTRATVIELGQSLFARRAIVGSYRLAEDRIQVNARVLDLERAAIMGVVQDEGVFSDLLHVQNQLSKNILRLEANEVPESFLVSARRRRTIPPEAYEGYVKALLADAESQPQILEGVLGRYPTYSEAKLLLGESFRRAGKPRQAMEVLASLLPEDPLYRTAYFAAGLAYLEANDPGGAAQIFTALAEREDAPTFYNNLGVARFREGKTADALRVLNRAVEKAPELGTALFNLGWVSWQSGKGADAVKWLKEAVRLDPRDGEAYFLLAAASASQALPDEAEEARRRAREISPELDSRDASTIKGLERVLDELPTSTPVLASDPVDGTQTDKVRYHIDRAHQHEAAGRREDALRELERAVYLSPYSDKARLELARVYKDAGNLEKAAGEVRVVLWNGASVEAHLLLAEILIAAGRLDEAKTALDAAAELDPTHPQLLPLRERLSAVKP